MADEGTNDCLNFRKLSEKLEGGQSLSESEQVSYQHHAECCRPCAAWCDQHHNLAQLAGALPQFDVSEGLTQKILSAVERESTPGIEIPLLPLGIVASLAFFTLVPFDSLQSLYGWGAGVLGLFALQFLIKTANANEQVV